MFDQKSWKVGKARNCRDGGFLARGAAPKNTCTQHSRTATTSIITSESLTVEVPKEPECSDYISLAAYTIHFSHRTSYFSAKRAGLLCLSCYCHFLCSDLSRYQSLISRMLNHPVLSAPCSMTTKINTSYSTSPSARCGTPRNSSSWLRLPYCGRHMAVVAQSPTPAHPTPAQ